MRTLVFFVLLFCLSAAGTIKEGHMFVYYYINMEENSTVIVMASSEVMAFRMITEELQNMGLIFEPTNITDIVPVQDMVVYSFSD